MIEETRPVDGQIDHVGHCSGSEVRGHDERKHHGPAEQHDREHRQRQPSDAVAPDVRERDEDGVEGLGAVIDHPALDTMDEPDHLRRRRGSAAMLANTRRRSPPPGGQPLASAEGASPRARAKRSEGQEWSSPIIFAGGAAQPRRSQPRDEEALPQAANQWLAPKARAPERERSEARDKNRRARSSSPAARLSRAARNHATKKRSPRLPTNG